MAALLTAALAAVAAASGAAAGFDRSNARYTEVLSTHVRDGLVHYAGLKAGRRELDGYLASLAGVGRTTFDEWPRHDRMAFLINAYNAFTLRLVVDHYPVASIKRIGGWFSGPWKQPVVRLWGRAFTLDEVEHGILRKAYADPRIHFALVCASVSCPDLRSEAFRGADLEAQLDDQGRRFLGNPAYNRFDPVRRRAELSSIFKWFAGDFGENREAVLATLARFAPRNVASSLREGGWTVTYLPYDWSLNDTSLPD